MGHFWSQDTRYHKITTHLVASIVAFVQNEGLTNLVVEQKLEVLRSTIIDNEDPIGHSYFTKANLVRIRIVHFCSGSVTYRSELSHQTIYFHFKLN